MRFTYPARLRPDSTGELIVSFRDLPACLTSGADEAEALAEAADALEEAIAGRMNRIDSIPDPSSRRAGEDLVAVPAETVAKAALAVALLRCLDDGPAAPVLGWDDTRRARSNSSGRGARNANEGVRGGGWECPRRQQAVSQPVDLVASARSSVG